MTAVRALTVAAVVAMLVLVASPVSAHGAPENPVSRAFGCGPAGQYGATAACKAAAAAGTNLAGWDSMRVPNVNGRDREMIPDGKLCSGGLAQYKGLDLARTDWPTTKLTAGSSFTFSYRQTIPHQGTFRVYITKDGYDPTVPLRWSDLESKPFLTATDPARDGASYRMKGTLPRGKSGRHVIYTIWQNSSTPDTYYACSDVNFVGATRSAAPSTAAPSAAASASAAAAAGDSVGLGAAPRATVPVSANRMPVMAAGGGALALVVLGGLTFVRLRRRSR
jgi:chitin-binding protein